MKVSANKISDNKHRFELSHSDRDLVAYYTVSIDGKELFTRKSESFHSGYYSFLYLSMYDRIYPWQAQAGTAFSVRNITSAVDNGGQFVVTVNSSNAMAYNQIFVYLHFPNSPEYSCFTSVFHRGKLRAVKTSLTVTTYPNWDTSEMAPPDTTGATATFFSGASYSSRGSYYNGINFYLGLNDDPINIFQAHRSNHVHTGLSAGTTSVGSVITQKDRSYFNVSRTYTNNTGETVNVKDVVISTGQASVDYAFVIIRDRFDASLPAGAQMTISYNIGAELSDNSVDTESDGSHGGFLSNYVDAMRLIFAGGSSNTNMPFGFALEDYHGGANISVVQHGNRGVMVGDNNEYVSSSDASLFGRIHFEPNGGPLRIMGTTASELIEDHQNNEAYWDIGKILKNISNDPVVIKEVGLSSSYGYVARHALHSTDWITIAPGEVKEISYRIKFTE